MAPNGTPETGEQGGRLFLHQSDIMRLLAGSVHDVIMIDAAWAPNGRSHLGPHQPKSQELEPLWRVAGILAVHLPVTVLTGNGSAAVSSTSDLYRLGVYIG